MLLRSIVLVIEFVSQSHPLKVFFISQICLLHKDDLTDTRIVYIIVPMNCWKKKRKEGLVGSAFFAGQSPDLNPIEILSVPDITDIPRRHENELLQENRQQYDVLHCYDDH